MEKLNEIPKEFLITGSKYVLMYPQILLTFVGLSPEGKILYETMVGGSPNARGEGSFDVLLTYEVSKELLNSLLNLEIQPYEFIKKASGKYLTYTMDDTMVPYDIALYSLDELPIGYLPPEEAEVDKYDLMNVERIKQKFGL